MTVFADYAKVYDLLYRDKDYAKEAEYCHGLIKRYSKSARSMLDLGCGTGRYEKQFSEFGYEVTGMDLSESMLDAARVSKAAELGVKFIQGDMRNFDIGRSFDVIQALFHVISYLESEDDLFRTFTSVKRHLKPGGIFVFDCWHGAGVLSDPPVVRILHRQQGALKVWRTAEPKLEADRNIVQVDYTILATEENGMSLREIHESHRMRYFFLPELRYHLMKAGLRIIDAHPSWESDGSISEKDWFITIVASAITDDLEAIQ